MKALSFFAATALLLCAASCKKTEIKDIEKSQGKITGQWKIIAIQVRTTDTTGRLLSDSSLADQGAVLFATGDKSAIGAGYFDHADFTGACANSELVQYFSKVAAGDRITNGWSLSWDADPDDLRLQLWAESAGGSYHRSLNLNHDGGMQLFYMLQPAYQNKRVFYTWKLTN